MTDAKFICDDPCPICGGEVQLFGSECYPEKGITFECLKCDYEGTITCSKRVSTLKEVAKEAHRSIAERISYDTAYGGKTCVN